MRLGDAESRQHWSKTKQGRANVCKKLGVESCIVQSVRQQQEPPSTTVLANALSAIIGAVWLDLEERGERTAAARTKVFNILRHMDSIVADTAQGTSNAAGEAIVVIPEGNQGLQSYSQASHFITSDGTVNENAIVMDTFIPQHLGENQQGVFGGTLTDLFSLHEMTSEPDFLLINEMNGLFPIPNVMCR